MVKNSTIAKPTILPPSPPKNGAALESLRLALSSRFKSEQEQQRLKLEQEQLRIRQEQIRISQMNQNNIKNTGQISQQGPSITSTSSLVRPTVYLYQTQFGANYLPETLST